MPSIKTSKIVAHCRKAESRPVNVHSGRFVRQRIRVFPRAVYGYNLLP